MRAVEPLQLRFEIGDLSWRNLPHKKPLTYSVRKNLTIAAVDGGLIDNCFDAISTFFFHDSRTSISAAASNLRTVDKNSPDPLLP
jgi:hypothetical protein